MTHEDFIYQHAFSEFNKLGHQQRDCEQVGAEALRLWKTNRAGKGFDAVTAAVKWGKKNLRISSPSGR